MGEENAERQENPSAWARAIGTGVSGLFIGTLVCVLTYILRDAGFRPLNELVAFEDRVYQALRPSPLDPVGTFRPVVFVDVDNYALEHWNPASFKPCNPRTAPAAATPATPISASAGTPRSMIAAVTQAMRAAQAKVVFLDYDLRNTLPDDQMLREELKCPSATTVLLPHFFANRTALPCGSVKGTDHVEELDTVFEQVMKPGQIEPVHPIVSAGSYGLIEGVCPYYRVRPDRFGAEVRRPGAMFRAVSLANEALATPIGAISGAQSLRWWIDGNTQNMLTDKNQLAYMRINASVLLQDGPVQVDPDGSAHTRTILLNAVKNAIVIVGSTHPGAGDFYETPLGDMPGALIHANLALALQVPPVPQVPLLLQAIVDVIISVPFAIFTTWFCWYRLYKKIGPDGQISKTQKMMRSVMEVFILLGMAGGLFVLTVMVAKLGYDIFAGWHFAILSFILGAMIVFLIEVTALAAEGVEHWAEAMISRRQRRVTGDFRVVRAQVTTTTVEEVISDERLET